MNDVILNADKVEEAKQIARQNAIAARRAQQNNSGRGKYRSDSRRPNNFRQERHPIQTEEKVEETNAGATSSEVENKE